MYDFEKILLKHLIFVFFLGIIQNELEVEMANIKSAKKRIDVIDRQTMENKTVKTKISTYAKKYKLAIDNGEKENAAKLLSETFSLIDSAVSKGVLQKATANRKKSRLSAYANK